MSVVDWSLDMDISNWPMENILQLPDSAFGMRYVVSIFRHSAVAGTSYDMSELSLPDRGVIFGFNFSSWTRDINTLTFRLGLGSQLPTSTDEFDKLDPLIPGFGRHGSDPRTFISQTPFDVELSRVKMPVHSARQKLIVETTIVGFAAHFLLVSVIVASIPKEIPDFYAGFPEDKFDEMIRLMRIGVKFR